MKNLLNTWNHPEYGDVQLRPVMFNLDGTTLQEGIEIKFLEEELPVIEIHGYLDLDNLTADEVCELIDERIDFENLFN